MEQLQTENRMSGGTGPRKGICGVYDLGMKKQTLRKGFYSSIPALAGILLMLLPLGSTVAMAGLITIGLGCAPIYPSIIHATPDHFGANRSQALIGVQMASAYVGILLMPPLFGLAADALSTGLLPFWLLAIAALMICMHERLCRVARPGAAADAQS